MANPGEWGIFHTAGYSVPTKRWADDYPGFKFHVANATERDENGEFIGENTYEVYGRYVGVNGEYLDANGEDPEGEDEPEPEQDSQDASGDDGSDDDFSPAANV